MHQWDGCPAVLEDQRPDTPAREGSVHVSWPVALVTEVMDWPLVETPGRLKTQRLRLLEVVRLRQSSEA